VKAYNGFTPEQRTKALYWLRKQQADGLRTRHVVCHVCGQTKGTIDDHSEDYSEPFGDNIGRFGLCFRCHMIVHCRFRAPESFETYRRLVMTGIRFAPIYGRNFKMIVGEHLDHQLTPTFTTHAPPGTDVLGRIAAGEFRPPSGE